MLCEADFEQYDIELLMPAVETAARRSTVPVAIHLHLGTSMEGAIRAINLGCNSVMVEVDSLRETKHIAEMAHRCGVPLEGRAKATSFHGLADFIKSSGVDFLAILPDTPDDTLTQIRAKHDTPFVIHDGDTVSKDDLQRLIGHGVARVNFTVENLSTAEQALSTLDCAGQADAVLENCTPWEPVEHLIIYNVSGISEEETHKMMYEGKRILAAIPGVRHVVIGEAVQDDADYRYTWLVRFCHPDVIASYRDHPDHVAFADNLFRPVAGGRISIDYQVI